MMKSKLVAVLALTALALGWRPTASALALPAWVILGTAAFAALGFALGGAVRAEATLAIANATFLVLVAVMVVNAVSYARTEAAQKGREMDRAELANRYLAIAALTVALVVTLGLVTWLGHWRHGTFWLEVVVIAAFAVFWAVQTAELWGEDEGLRPDPEGVLAPQSKAGEVGTQ